jgi:hypothetical protein
MSAPLWFAIALTRAWTATYTRGLPADLRAQRREEIDCDLWEHQRLADLQREPTGGTAASILLRLLLGVPADIVWRLETGASARSGRGTRMNDTPLMRIGLIVLMLPLLFMAANGIGMLLGGGEFDSRQEQVLYGFVVAIAPLVALAGLWLCASRPKLGLGLVVAGVVPICALFYWMLFITVPVALVIIAFAVRRGGLWVWPSGGPRPSAAGGA